MVSRTDPTVWISPAASSIWVDTSTPYTLLAPSGAKSTKSKALKPTPAVRQVLRLRVIRFAQRRSSRSAAGRASRRRCS